MSENSKLNISKEVAVHLHKYIESEKHALQVARYIVALVEKRLIKLTPDAAYCRCDPATCGTIPGTYPARCSACTMTRR